MQRIVPGKVVPRAKSIILDELGSQPLVSAQPALRVTDAAMGARLKAMRVSYLPSYHCQLFQSGVLERYNQSLQHAMSRLIPLSAVADGGSGCGADAFACGQRRDSVRSLLSAPRDRHEGD